MNPEDTQNIIAYAKHLPDHAIIVEIGTCEGEGAILLADSSPLSAHIWTIDCGEAELYGFGGFYRADPVQKGFMTRRLLESRRRYERKLSSIFTASGHKDKITFLFGSSHPHEYLSMADWPVGRLVDLLLVDGDHYYPSLMGDMLRWMPKVKLNGYVLFHDYNGWDVAMATRHYLEAYPEWVALEQTEMMLYCQKRLIE